MAHQNTSKENYDDSMLKCKKIDAVVPSLCEDIRLIKLLDESFKNDLDLQMADQLLGTLKSLDDADSKIKYVNDYRGNLTAGLTCLGSFMEHLTDLQKLSEVQRQIMATIAGDIVKIQDAITNIATH